MLFYVCISAAFKSYLWQLVCFIELRLHYGQLK
jgi:hypothetical protein